LADLREILEAKDQEISKFKVETVESVNKKKSLKIKFFY
jgi:hypothetical protein